MKFYEQGFEAIQHNLSPEEACLSTLLDLNAYQELGARTGKAVANFYAASNGT